MKAGARGSAPPRPTATARLLGVVPEALAVALGVLVRLRLHRTYDPTASYDYSHHLRYIDYVARFHTLPPINAFRTAYHPPLFYWMGAWLLRRGDGVSAIQWSSIACGIAALGILWIGLRRLLPGDPLARTLALLLAAILPSLVHLFGMVTNEPLLVLLSSAALLLLTLLITAEGWSRLLLAVLLGGVLGLALLTKVSALIVVLLVGAAFLAALAGGVGRRPAARLRHAAPLLLSIAIALAVWLPIQARNLHATHKLLPTGFDGRAVERRTTASVEAVPYRERRPLSFIVGLTGCPILERPWSPTCTRSESRFFPVLFASTFGDFYNFGFAGPSEADWTRRINTKPMSEYALRLQRVAVLGGLPIAAVTTLALVVVLWRSLLRRDLVIALLLFAPVLAVLGQLHFAITYPFDQYGPIKGSYLHFATAPLFGLFGVAASWCWRSRWLRPVTLGLIGALLLVAASTLSASRLALSPAGRAHDFIVAHDLFSPDS
jgi:4-amino-4-deoxy-L-arabinose transferase-like glycosyltransferase